MRSKIKVSQRSLRYAKHRLMVMHPHTWMILFIYFLFDLKVKGQGAMKVNTERDTRLMVMHAHTKYYWPISKDKNAMARTRKYFKKRLVDLEVKGQCPTRVISVHDTLPYGHAPTCQISLTKKLWSGQDSLRRSRRSGRKNHTKTICLPSFEGET